MNMPEQPTNGIYKWFDERMGLRQLAHFALDEPIPGGPRFAYIFGSALLAVFLLQVLSGIALMLYYVPSVDHAHTSVAYIMKVITAGSFIRGLHVYGASAMVILLVLHLAQTFLYGSYKGRRELQWLSGCILLVLVLGMGFTGYLLPWDQKAYFATKVGTNVPSEIPVVGNAIKHLMLGGSTLGALTLSRFFVIHVIVLPALIVLFVGSHLWLLRKRGSAGPIREDPFVSALSTGPLHAGNFYPGQLMRDLVGAIVVIIVIGLFAHFVPADLGLRANPADTQFLPRPDWYFRFLFQWLKYWPGATVAIGLGLIPAVVTVLFFGLPFFDRRPERRPWRRPVSVAIFVVILGGIAGLTYLSYRDDSHDSAIAAQMDIQRQKTAMFMRSAFQPDGAASAAPAPPAVLAEGQEFVQSHECFTCHGRGGVGTRIAPPLTGIAQKYSTEDLTYLLRHPTQKMKDIGMAGHLNFNDQQLAAVIAYIQTLK